MNSTKELLVLKSNIRRGLPNSSKEMNNLLMKIFSLKYKMSENDFKAKEKNPAAFDNVPLEEFPLSDTQFASVLTKPNANVKSVYKILSEISDNNASITYAPLLSPIVLFLLQYLSETETKNCADRLLTDQSMIPATKTEWNNVCHLLYKLGSKFATKAHRQIDKSATVNEKQLVYWPYIVWQLPNEHLTRVLFCYLIEGIKVIYRAGLLIWKECFNRHKTEINGSNFKDLLIKTAQSIEKTYSSQQFLNRMFRIRNFSRKSVDRMRSQLQSASLETGDWICPTACKQYVAFKKSHSNPSHIVTSDELIEVIRQLEPVLSQICRPVSIFFTNTHGYSLSSLFNCVENNRDTLLILETAKNEVIGAFCSDPWTLKNRAEPKRYYGKGSCFVFKIRPKPFEVFRWNRNTGANVPDMFQRATADCLEIGGGSQGAAISIDKNLNKGTSAATSTFNNTCLTPYSGRDFLIKSLELLGFSEISAD